MKRKKLLNSRERGFSMIEMMLVLVILSIVVGGIFTQMDQAQKRAYTEVIRLDSMQEARDFVDQFLRDINQIGYPNAAMRVITTLSWSPALSTPASYAWNNVYANDNRMAIGLVKIDNTAIQFEADTNGDGNVQSVQYKINGNGGCALCLQRSQVDKVAGNPLAVPPNWGTEVNDALNPIIFSYFKDDGTQIPSASRPLDISTLAGAQTLAPLKTLKISLLISNPIIRDIKTNQVIQTSFEGEVSLNNCSMAAANQQTSC